VGWFEAFQRDHSRELGKASKNDLLEFLAHLRAKRYKQGSLGHIFAALSSFYDFLEDTGRIQSNPVPAVQKRYLRPYKANIDRDERRCPSVEECSQLIKTRLVSRDQAIMILLAKTGMRRHELTALDVSDIDAAKKRINSEAYRKANERTLFFDDEAAIIVQRWLSTGASMDFPEYDGSLFVTSTDRFSPKSVYTMVINHSRRIGIADPKIGGDLFTPHYFRIFFTNMLLRAGMPREHVMALRGDVGSAIDIYNRIEKEDLKRSYLAHIPQLA
jgi:integrase/recombinase XerD